MGSLRLISRVAAITLFFAAAALAQERYPSKPIHFILPYAGGGSADALARAIAEDVRERLGQPQRVGASIPLRGA